MGFLYALLLMCSWMIYGGAHFYVNVCNVTMEEGNKTTHSIAFDRQTHPNHIELSFSFAQVQSIP